MHNVLTRILFVCTEAKQSLLDEGFATWNVSDFKRFYEALIDYGADDVASIAARMPGKSPDEVARYKDEFLKRGRSELANFDIIEARLKRKDKWREAWRKKVDAFQWKCAQFADPAKELHLTDASSSGSPKKRQDNDILLRALFEVGINSADAFGKVHAYLRCVLPPLPNSLCIPFIQIDKLTPIFIGDSQSVRRAPEQSAIA